MGTVSILVGTLVIWYVIVLVLLATSRARPLVAGPPTMQLRPEPPAIVNLLVTGCGLTQAAADATLIDLAARRILELHQPGTRPGDLLIRVRMPDPVGLAAYERRVFDRVAADGRFVALAEVTRRYAESGPHWFAQLRAEVIEDAQRRGLVRTRRMGNATIAVSMVAGLVLACSGVLDMPKPNTALVLGSFCAYPVISLILILIAQAHVRSARDTDQGWLAGCQWLGVAAWLTAHPDLADLPPESVAVWDRYLAYGVALGVNPVAEESVDLRVGMTGRFLSRYGGSPHTVVAHYPRNPFAYSQAGLTAMWSTVMLLVWVAASLVTPQPWTLVATMPLALRSAYRLIRGAAAKLAPVTVTGLVLGAHPRRPRASTASMWTEFVLDDGTSAPTRPWLIRGDRSEAVRPGAVIRVRGQAWNRYAMRAETVAPAVSSRHDHGAV